MRTRKKYFSIYLSHLPYMEPTLVGVYGDKETAEFWKEYKEASDKEHIIVGYVYEIREE